MEGVDADASVRMQQGAVEEGSAMPAPAALPGSVDQSPGAGPGAIEPSESLLHEPAKPVASGAGNEPGEAPGAEPGALTDDKTPTPTPNDHVAAMGGSRVTSEEDLAARPNGDFCAEKTALYGSSDINLASLTSTSNVSSPLHSTYASSASLESSQASNASAADGDEETYGHLDEALAITPVSSGASLPLQVTPTASNTGTPRQDTTRHETTTQDAATQENTTQARREGPHYPNQSFLALQSQIYPSAYQSHPLRTQRSHPSQHSAFASDSSSRRSRDRVSMASGAKTVGNTPAQSPGLFSAPNKEASAARANSREGQYSTPLLHPTHFQPPKETHKLLKDIDPISGRKIVNNYEFQAKLGSGAHGTVKLGRNLLTGELVAIKIVRRFSKKVRLGKQGDPEEKVKKEVAVLKKARHPHVVSLLEVIDDIEWGKVYLILEYVERGEIIWRKPTIKDIAIFEMNRIKREMQNPKNVDEAYESDLLAKFNQDAPRRRMENDRLLAEQSRQAKERLSNELEIAGKEEEFAPPEVSSFWSLEHGGESGDEKEKSKTSLLLPKGEGEPEKQPVVQSDSLPPGSSEDVTTPTPNPLLNPQDALAFAGGYGIRSESPAIPEGVVWEPHPLDVPPLPHNDTAFKATLDRIIVEQTPLSEEEEEYRYVPCLTLSQALEAFRDTVLGLEYLHYQGIIHRDIKPANLLWTAEYRVKISDFGVSYLGRPIREDDNHDEKAEADAANLDEAIELAKTVGTPAFYAPELCDPDLFDLSKTSGGRPLITGQIDVWALGVTLYGMVYGRLPFFDVNEFAMYEKIARQPVSISSKRLKGVEDNSRETTNPQKRPDDFIEYETVDDELQDLLKRLLHKNPLKRITLQEVKHHPWVLRGITDHSSWIDETDPSLQSQGQKIEVSHKDIVEAVAPLTVIDRLKLSLRRLDSVVRGRNSRKRAESNTKQAETSVSASSRGSGGEPESRRGSLRGDEQIFSALRASREHTVEHPLAQSLAASPDIASDPSYFPEQTAHASTSSWSQRPAAERTVSTTESIKTIRAHPPDPVRRSTPAIIAEDLPEATPVIGSATSSSSSISGIFGGAGRRLVRSMRSRDRGRCRDNASQSSRSSSIENMAASFEDSYASPSVAMSSATAAGHVDQPPVLREIDVAARRTSIISSHSSPSSRHPGESSAEAFQLAQEQNNRRHVQETVAANRTRSRANTASLQPCPPSPDDEIFQARQVQSQPPSQSQSRDPLTAASSDDQVASSISESFSLPSIASAVSGASSLSAKSTAEEQERRNQAASLELMTTSDTITTSRVKLKSRASGPLGSDEDEAGYNGDGDEEEEEDLSDDDGGIVFGKKK